MITKNYLSTPNFYYLTEWFSFFFFKKKKRKCYTLIKIVLYKSPLFFYFLNILYGLEFFLNKNQSKLYLTNCLSLLLRSSFYHFRRCRTTAVPNSASRSPRTKDWCRARSSASSRRTTSWRCSALCPTKCASMRTRRFSKRHAIGYRWLRRHRKTNGNLIVLHSIFYIYYQILISYLTLFFLMKEMFSIFGLKTMSLFIFILWIFSLILF